MVAGLAVILVGGGLLLVRFRASTGAGSLASAALSLGASEGDRRSRPPSKPTCPSSEAGYTFAGVTSDPHATSTPARPRTDADRVADDYFDAAVRLSPIMATNAGVPGHEEDLDDVSPAGRAAFSALRRQTLAALADVEPIDDVDRVTISALHNRLELDEEIHAALMGCRSTSSRPRARTCGTSST